MVTQNSTLRVLGYSADFSQSGQTAPLTIIFPPSFTLTATTAGGGTITLNPPGGTYLSNAVVGITGVTNAGWGFLQWTGDATGTNRSNSVVMNGNRAVQALFGTAVGTTVAGGGSVWRNPAGVVYPYGTTIQLSAVPQAGNQFAVWGNAASGNLNPLGFVVTNANPTVSSLFVPLNAGQVALAVIPVGHGTCDDQPAGQCLHPGRECDGNRDGEHQPVVLGLERGCWRDAESVVGDDGPEPGHLRELQQELQSRLAADGVGLSVEPDGRGGHRVSVRTVPQTCQCGRR